MVSVTLQFARKPSDGFFIQWSYTFPIQESLRSILVCFETHNVLCGVEQQTKSHRTVRSQGRLSQPSHHWHRNQSSVRHIFSEHLDVVCARQRPRLRGGHEYSHWQVQFDIVFYSGGDLDELSAIELTHSVPHTLRSPSNLLGLALPVEDGLNEFTPSGTERLYSITCQGTSSLAGGDTRHQPKRTRLQSRESHVTTLQAGAASKDPARSASP